MSDAVFNRLYRALNPKQKEAVDAIDGPVVVIAGPGTGKTSLLTLRIANILQRTDTPPDAILALSFTEAGVRAMRKKLLDIIGPRSYEVRIHTFHSFCNDLIKRYPEAFSRIVGAEHMEDLEQIRIVEELIDKSRSSQLRPRNNPAYYVLPIIGAIKDLKREDVSPREYGAWLKRARDKSGDALSRSHALAKLYAAYEREIRRRRLYDFEDMVIEAVRALERSRELKLRLQEEYHYVLADEHQDANRAQNRLLELLCDYDPRPNLCIVGDEKQALIRFQGASLENFLYFKRQFRTARVVALTENYRSQETVLKAAHSLIEKNRVADADFHAELTPRAKHARRKIGIVEAKHEDDELLYIVREVQKLVKRGTALKEIAVFARDNKGAETVEEVLRRAGIAVARRGGMNVLESVRIDSFRKLLMAVVDPVSDELLAPALFFDFLNLPPLPVMEAVHTRDGGTLLRRIGAGGAELRSFQTKLLAWQRLARNEPLVPTFETIAHESGFLERSLSREDAPEILAGYTAFLESAKRLAERDKRAKLDDFLERLTRAEAHGIGVHSSTEEGDGVQVMTAHKAKGLEFDFVFIVFAEDGVWGGRRGRELFWLPLAYSTPHLHSSTPDVEEDERRLFYVALTRARKGAVVSWHAKGRDGRALLPSRFLFEIAEEHRVHVQATPRVGEDVTRRVAQPPARITMFKDRAYLKALFLKREFSVTHLNNFLECPWRYFFLNLVRLPRVQSGAELYGSAMHAALATHFDAYAREEDKSPSETLAFFESALRRTHLAEADFRRYVADGKRDLKGYLTSQTFPRAIWNEYAIHGVPLKVDGQRVEIGGKLDRIEFLSSGSVNVVDYKTGAPKTRNEILGKTKNADGNYYRQLVFYKLLLQGRTVSRKKGSTFIMKTGTLDFLKPTPSGTFRREVFEIEEREVAELRKLVVDVCSQILSLSFANKGCGGKGCEYCRLSKALA